ncbi:hypothetical protein J6G99_01140 [bacterium]|nr:hypothetical protein [bacterium]
MQYYDNSLLSEDILNYFKKGIKEHKISHCLLFWGADSSVQCALALEIARLLNCREDGNSHCECLNCRWIKENSHPAVKIITRLDFKENSDDEEGGKKNINVSQARSIISELTVTSDYHRVYIFCDRDEDGNLLPLNQINFPEVTSNALLKTFEEPPENTTFIFLTKDKTDVISTVVSRAQSFFISAKITDDRNFDLVENSVSNYWTLDKGQVLDFEAKLLDLLNDNEPKVIFTQIQNYMYEILKSNFENKNLYYKIMEDLKYVEDAKRQVSLIPAMNILTVCENLSFKLFLR